MAFTQAPPRRRMVRPLRQQVDRKFVLVPEADFPDVEVDSAHYDCTGKVARATARPGSLLSVRV